MSQTVAKGNYVSGKFAQPTDPNGEWKVFSPADLTDEVGTLQYSYQDVDRAVDSATGAFKKWRKTPYDDRVKVLKKFAEAAKGREDEFTQMISRESGKPNWEARGEAKAVPGKVGVTIEHSMKLVSDFKVDEILPGVRGACTYRPHGVMAVLGPFNFPAHLANGHIVPAILTGNSVVFKPSEKTPLTGQLLAECWDEAGLPEGVFNLVQGEKEVGRRLAIHEDVSGILFTGSYEVGLRIKQDTLQQHWKILALEMGGKNSAIVWEDADIENALREVFFGAYVTTGQRCSATSRVMVHSKLKDQFVEKFHEMSKNFEIGKPQDNPFMGPLIDQSALDRYQKFNGIASREGCEVVMRGKTLSPGGAQGHYVSPSICVVGDNSLAAAEKSVYQQTEIFGPNVAVIEVSELDEAIAHSNVTQYGLVTSVFSQSKSVFDRCFDDIEAGLINWNKSTVGASGRLPFGGLKKSGNHFPTALSAPIYSAFPVASLEVDQPKVGAPFQGTNWGK